MNANEYPLLSIEEINFVDDSILMVGQDLVRMSLGTLLEKFKTVINSEFDTLKITLAEINHTHEQQDIVNLIENLNALQQSVALKLDTTSYVEVDVAGIMAALEAKADEGHAHSTATITGLAEALLLKASIQEVQDIDTRLQTLEAEVEAQGDGKVIYTYDQIPGLQGNIDNLQYQIDALSLRVAQLET